ncbi:MAG TPA: peptidoglycan-binding domain-containing protein [Solirubrobacteraceae bacterium]|nr:peptidoglycan-binding domain-containing protein [Solirubrobacteraceae bacterium]
MPGLRPVALAVACAAGLALAPAGADAQSRRGPVLTGLRCVPATRAVCRERPQVRIGGQVQLRGRRLRAGMRVSFRWSRGALATRLRRTGTGWVVRVPAGTKAGTVSVRVTDRAGRRSRVIRLVVLPVATVSPAASGALPAVFRDDGMWIWHLSRSSGGDPAAIGAQARAAGIETVFVKSSDGTTPWPQFNPALVAALHAQGLRACAWQFVYGADPAGEAVQGAAAVAAGADCLVIDAESRYEGRYAQAQRYIAALRAAIGPAYPLGLTTFPYVDYHPRFPYSVFLAPGAAQANLPQVYWKDIGGSVDAVSARTWAHNRVYGVPVAPLGQAYQAPAPADIQRFRQVWASYGARGLSWWSWQASSAATWATLAAPPPAPVPLPDPGWPVLARGSRGDEVVWLQQHLASIAPATPIDGVLGASTAQVLAAVQSARGLPATGETDPATWQAVLSLPLAPVDWTARAG